MVEEGKKTVDWFLNKNALKQLLVILILVIGYLGYHFQKNLNEQAIEFAILKTENAKLKSDVEKLKLENIASKAAEDKSPLPMWLVDSKTNAILWVNRAYERKYLIPKNTTRNAFIGTDGRYVFGDVVDTFHENNKMVYILQRPLTFKNETQSTLLKYPVSIGDYTYAIGGIEYLMFDR